MENNNPTYNEAATGNKLSAIIATESTSKPASQKITRSLTYHIAKKGQLSLFDGFGGVKEAWEQAGVNIEKAEKRGWLQKFIDNNGKEVLLSNSAARLLDTLSALITEHYTDEDIFAYAKNLPASINSEPWIKRTFLMSDLAKLIYGRSGEGELIRLQQDFIELIGYKSQIMKLRGKVKGKEETFTVAQSLISFGSVIYKTSEELQTMKKAGRKKKADSGEKTEQQNILYLAEIKFHPAFFWGLEDDYCAVKLDKLLPIWRIYGKTDLWYIVLNLLRTEYKRAVMGWRYASKTLYNELKERKQRIPKEEYKRRIKEEELRSLTYIENLQELDSRLPKPYASRKKRMREDLSKVIEGLKEYGIITDGKIAKESVMFVLNPNFHKYEPTEEEKLLLQELSEDAGLPFPDEAANYLTEEEEAAEASITGTEGNSRQDGREEPAEA